MTEIETRNEIREDTIIKVQIAMGAMEAELRRVDDQDATGLKVTYTACKSMLARAVTVLELSSRKRDFCEIGGK